MVAVSLKKKKKKEKKKKKKKEKEKKKKKKKEKKKKEKKEIFFFKQKTAYEIGVRLVGSEMCIRDRPMVAGMAIGLGQAALDMTRALLAEEGYEDNFGGSMHQQTAIQHELEMLEAFLIHVG